MACPASGAIRPSVNKDASAQDDFSEGVVWRLVVNRGCVPERKPVLSTECRVHGTGVFALTTPTHATSFKRASSRAREARVTNPGRKISGSKLFPCGAELITLEVAVLDENF